MYRALWRACAGTHHTWDDGANKILRKDAVDRFLAGASSTYMGGLSEKSCFGVAETKAMIGHRWLMNDAVE